MPCTPDEESGLAFLHALAGHTDPDAAAVLRHDVEMLSELAGADEQTLPSLLASWLRHADPR